MCLGSGRLWLFIVSVVVDDGGWRVMFHIVLAGLVAHPVFV